MDLVLLIAWMFAVAATLSTAFRGGVDTPSWELRWESLDDAERSRISAAAHSGTKLEDPEDAELAAGFMRRNRRRAAYVELPMLSIVVVLTAGAVAGLVGDGLVALILGGATAVVALWRYLRDKHMDGTPRAATAPDAGL